MKKYIVETHGIDPDKIIEEDYSTTTYENRLFSKQIIDRHILNSRGDFRLNQFPRLTREYIRQ